MTARLAVAGAVFVLLTVWTHARPRAAHVDVPDFAAAVPLVFDAWIGRDAPPLDPGIAKTLAADRYVHRYYGRRGTGSGSRPADIEMDIAYYARPEAGAAMHSPLNCLPGNGWQVLESRSVSRPIGGTAAPMRTLVVARGADRVAMSYWYQNRGAFVSDEYRQRFELLKNGLRGRPTDAAIVRVMALDTAEGHVLLSQFTRVLAARLAVAFR